MRWAHQLEYRRRERLQRQWLQQQWQQPLRQ
jgi:hypothetical protein